MIPSSSPKPIYSSRYEMSPAGIPPIRHSFPQMLPATVPTAVGANSGFNT
ncbi:hypothetical protein [Brevibacillus invocatus]|nr:hypothetical protein [Brevibacillus invocatus]